MQQRFFAEGERVLCYDPNPTRLQVLYDAKILRVNKTKDGVEYYIHFLGWSSSWDRYISPDLLLEDTDENRQLQAELNAEAKKRTSKKKRPRLSGQANGCLSTVSESSREDSNSDREDSDSEGLCDSFALPLPDELRQKMIYDRQIVKTKGKLHKLPASHDVVSILENYVQHYAFHLHYVRAPNEAPMKRPRGAMASSVDRRSEVELCKETVDGLRILFNNLCDKILLYAEERDQFSRLKDLSFNRDAHEKQRQSRRTSELELLLAQLEYSFIANKLPQAWDNETHRARSLRISTQHASIASGTLKRTEEDEQSDSATITSWTSMTSPATSALENASKWRMTESGLWPAQVYGAHHLLRLLSKVPSLVPHLQMTRTKAEVLRRHLTLLVNYLTENESLFEAQFE